MDRDEELAQELAASADVPPADSSRLTPAEAVSRRMRTWQRAFLREQGTPATEEDMAASQTYKALVAKLRRIEEQAAQEAERQAALEAHRKEEEALEIFLSMPRYANQSRPRRYGIRTELSAAAAAAADAADAAGSRSPRVIEAEAALEQAAAGSVLLGFLRPEGRRTLAAAMEAVTVPAGKTIYAVGQVGSPPAASRRLPPRGGCLCPSLPPPLTRGLGLGLGSPPGRWATAATCCAAAPSCWITSSPSPRAASRLPAGGGRASPTRHAAPSWGRRQVDPPSPMFPSLAHPPLHPYPTRSPPPPQNARCRPAPQLTTALPPQYRIVINRRIKK